MKYLEVESFTPPAGLEYSAVSYPHDGMFINDSGVIVAVGKNMVFICPNLDAFSVRELVEKPEPQVQGGVSESVFLKALLIMREPHLVNKLDL